MRWKSKVTAARALSARLAAPSSTHPQEMEKLEAVEKQGCAGWIFTWLELGVDSSSAQGGKDGFMQAWLIGRALVL